MNNHTIIFKALVGSQAYGTSTPASDVDVKGVYIQHPDDILTFNYLEQLNVTKDECYYEVRRFLELLRTANPTVLELLFTPADCIIEKNPVFDIILKHRDKFLTKQCYNSFGKYAESQISKARGLDKKMNWEKDRMTRKGILDFCYVLIPNNHNLSFKEWFRIKVLRQEVPSGTIPLKEWMQKNNLTQDKLGACKIPNAREMYYIYPKDNDALEYRGLTNADETSNDLRLCSIPMSENHKGIAVAYNKDGYVKHCNDYRSYLFRALRLL